MTMKKLLMVCLMAPLMFLVGCESAQQKAYDLKADTIGTHRVVEVYTEAGNKVATIEDGSMQFQGFSLTEKCRKQTIII
jgi:outer membrane lipoprotein-sorting protein